MQRSTTPLSKSRTSGSRYHPLARNPSEAHGKLASRLSISVAHRTTAASSSHQSLPDPRQLASTPILQTLPHTLGCLCAPQIASSRAGEILHCCGASARRRPIFDVVPLGFLMWHHIKNPGPPIKNLTKPSVTRMRLARVLVMSISNSFTVGASFNVCGCSPYWSVCTQF